MNKFKILIFTLLSFAIILSVGFVAAAQSTVNLGTSGNFVILSKTGISTTGTTSIIGNIGVSPIDSTAITGFGLIMDSSNQFSISSLVTGKIYAADYTAPISSVMTTAVSDMQTAYSDAAGRTETSIVTELGAGDISGMTLTPGLYKWGTGVLINTGITLSGGANDIWIFQIAQDLTVGNGAIITLSGGAQPKNIFWQVAGQTTLRTTSDFKGIILCQTLIEMQTGATLNGRALAQTAVTLDANAVTAPGTASVVVPENLVSAGGSGEVTTPTDSNPTSGNENSNSNSHTRNNNNNNNNGIEQNLNQQITEKRTEYKSGNFTTSLGQTLNVRETVAGMLELREGNAVVKTKLNLTKVENNKSKIEVKLSNGNSVELKIMPSTASETALARLRLKVCNETNNCTIILKEVGIGAETKLAYQIKAQKNVRILGLFKAKMNIEANVDAETGNVISEHKPWWAFIATQPAE